MFSKFNAAENFDDLKEIVTSYLDLLEVGVAVSDGFQFSEDLPEIIQFGSNLPAAVAGFSDGVEALKTLTPEQRTELNTMITDRKSFPNDLTDDAVDKITIGAIYFAQGTMILLEN